MGTRRIGARPVPYSYFSDRGVATLNARIGGIRHRPSLGILYDPDTASARDVRLVEAAAAKKYGELVAGRALTQGPGARVLTSMTFEELGGTWLEREVSKLWPNSLNTRVIQLRNVTTWAEEAPRFAKDHRTPLERIAEDAGPMQYATDRLAMVLRDTVDKEISNLFRFLSWATRERHLSVLPQRPELPGSSLGVRAGPQREKPVDITDAEALAIIDALPEWAVRGGRGIVPGKPLPPKAFRVRDVVRLAYELALRPGEAGRFEVPRHYVRGQRHIQFLEHSNKTGWDGRIPITEVAREILERCAPDSGLIFGRHDIRNHIKAAAAKVLPPDKAKTFARYDFRHGRLNHALEISNGDLQGVSGLARHLRMTTTNRYVRAHERHVAGLVAKLDAVRTRSGVAPCCPVLSSELCETIAVRRRGLEPLRFYPLAPQKSAHEPLRELSCVLVCHKTSTNDVRRASHHAGWSGAGQDAALGMAKAFLKRDQSMWAALDAFVVDEVTS